MELTRGYVLIVALSTVLDVGSAIAQNGDLLSAAPSESAAEARASPASAADLAGEMEAVLKTNVLEAWYPLVVDTVHGGYLSRFTHDWRPVEPQRKMIVTQARHVWTTSKAAARYPQDPRYLEAARHGFEFLRDVMWDDEHGGFFHLVDRAGAPIGDPLIKHAYGNAFAIYGLAAYFRTTGDPAALDLVRRAFDWLDRNSHDPDRGGYYQFMDRDGNPYKDGYEDTPPKDQNSSIHLLEAFTELYSATGDSLVAARLAEMLTLIRDTMVAERGYLRLFFQDDWTPVSYRDSAETVREANYFLDHVSFGHDVETAYLMLDAEEALGNPSRGLTREIGKRLVDHALRHGWDDRAGGFYDRGYYFALDSDPTIILDTKTWWAQAEALNTLLLLAQQLNDQWYRDRFLELWEYVKANLIDHRNGGWYASGLDKSPDAALGLKAQVWKGNYHTARALMLCIDRLR